MHTPIVDRLYGLVTRPRVRLISTALIAVALILLATAFATSHEGRTVFGSTLGADYATFYVAGAILNSATPERLYDLPLQSELYHQVIPHAPPDEGLPFPFAPFLAALVRPFSALPYAWSYLMWLILGMALYLVGFHMLWKAIPEMGSEDHVLAALVAVSFMPFLFECWIGGQASFFAVLSVGLAIYLQSRGRSVLSGAALAFCLFKPTLLIVLLPMLAITRQFRTLAGVGGGSALLVGVSAAAVGWQVCRSWAELLVIYARTTASAPDVFRIWKYVDLNSFLEGIWPTHPLYRQCVLALVLGAALILLIRVWWRPKVQWDDATQLSWACALTWSCLLSPHWGVYDSVLLLPSVLLTAGVQKRACPSRKGVFAPGFGFLVVVLYATSCFSQPLARVTGVQVYTLAIAAVGLYQIAMAWRESDFGHGIPVS